MLVRRMLARPGFLIAGLLLSLAAPATATAQSGVAVTPNRLSYLVNKDLAGERWTISLNLSAEDPARKLITNVTGNVFRQGQPPAFVVCQVRPGSSGDLADPSSGFRFSCDGASDCADTALACSQSSWSLLVRDLDLPASFFLPSTDGASASRRSSLADGVKQAAGDRGATLSYDGLSFLVSKDIGDQRWSIGVNLAPTIGESGQPRNELVSVTGNVFNRDGTLPQFVFCEVADGSQGDLGIPDSTFRFRCFGGDACSGPVEQCATGGWTLISDSIELQASFFLPVGGDGIPRSDAEIVVIGRTSDPPSIGTNEYTVPGDSAVADVAQGACAGPCLANRIGDCPQVPGQLQPGADGACFCLVSDLGDSCITCGQGETTGGCGRPCSYPVGTKTARGTCLRFNALSPDCLCNAVGAGGGGTPDSCGGPLGAGCGKDTQCCVDDPTDGCDPANGDAQCAGRCAGTGGCDPVTQQCGFCVTPCGNGAGEGPEQCDGSDLRGATCASRGLGSGTLACRADCTFEESGCGACGNGAIDGNEACDGADLGGKTCESLGLPSGALRCESDCTLDTGDCLGFCRTEAPCLEASLGKDQQCTFRDTCPQGQTCSCPGGGDGCGDRQLTCLGSCGNAVKDLGEQCDGPDLGGASCQSEFGVPGQLGCSQSCQFDPSGCDFASGDSCCIFESFGCAAVDDVATCDDIEIIFGQSEQFPGTSCSELEQCNQ